MDVSRIVAPMIWQIAKGIGGMATVMDGRIDRIILTGGLARSQRLCKNISAKINFIAPIEVISGSLVLEALAEGVWRVLDDLEIVNEYA